jgi:hypothetical protein
MGQISFPYPAWTRTAALILIFVWAPFVFLRKLLAFDIFDIEVITEPICVGMIILFFSKEKVDDERIHYLKFRALAFAAINSAILCWVMTKLLFNWDYSVSTDKLYPMSASMYIILMISLAYARLFYLKMKS